MRRASSEPGRQVLALARQLQPDIVLLHGNPEKFVDNMVQALRHNTMNEFKTAYRGLSALLIDDIQFFANKDRSQEEFFHTFNALHESHKQIVLTCDRPPNEIQGLEQRLVSRFEWGLVTDMQPPDVEMRLAILKKKAEAEAVPLPDNVAIYIAGKIKSNIRDMKGIDESMIRSPSVPYSP